jgi:hypothetical protein
LSVNQKCIPPACSRPELALIKNHLNKTKLSRQPEA